MNYPSIKTLARIFGENAKKARHALTCTRQELLEQHEGARVFMCVHWVQ